MFGGLYGPRYRHCADCGGCVPTADLDGHVCEQERWLDYQLFQRREELERFESELGVYLASPRGRFELWCAERDRTAASG